MKKVLIVATVPSMIGQFNMSNIKILQNMQYKVEVACNFKDKTVWDERRISELKEILNLKRVQFYQIDFIRNAFDIPRHFKAYKQLKKLVHRKKYEIIHCHTPIAAMIARIVAHQEKIKIIYTAHGFHFFKGAPIKNWFLYYPVEKFLSQWTDCLITINKEDYHRAKRKFYAKRTEYIPGVGVNTKKFRKPAGEEVLEIKKKKRMEFGLNIDDFVIVSVGELNENKNHQVIIKAIAKMKNKKIKYLICGQGELQQRLLYLIKEYNLEEQVFLLGFRNDIKEILWAGDLFAFPSRREGLGLAAIEAMAAGLPIITSNIHGINDYSVNSVTGYSCDSNNENCMKKAIEILMNNKKIYIKCSQNVSEIAKRFDVVKAERIMTKIYDEMKLVF